MNKQARKLSDHSIVVVMPAYNAERTLKITHDELPREMVDEIILVDDGSYDQTVRIAKRLGLRVFVHNRNYGYGANQKTCYTEALKTDATIIVMLHPDYQYDPRLLPEIAQPIVENRADVVFGSRLMGLSAWRQGMPWWKFLSNKVLTQLENWVFGLKLTEYHTGYRAYRREVLESVNYHANSDAFIFDQEIVAQMVEERFQFAEVSVPVRYFAEASSAGFLASVWYGMGILGLLVRYLLHRWKLWQNPQFDSPNLRYREILQVEET